MSDKYETLRRIKEEYTKKVDNTRWIATGVIKQVRKKDRKVIVTIMPEAVDTNWIRVYFAGVGSNYLTGALPEVGTTVVLLFIGANPNSAIVLAGGVLDAGDTAPSVVDDYTVLIGDKFGNKIQMDSNGITITSSKDVKINVNGNADIETTGTLKLNGGSSPVAKVGDEVATPVGPGKIVGPGNSKVLV